MKPSLCLAIAALALSACAPVKGRSLRSDYGTGGSGYQTGGSGYDTQTYYSPPPAVQYWPPPTAQYAAPPPPYYPPGGDCYAYPGQKYEIQWTYPSDLVPPYTTYPNQTAYVGDTVKFKWMGNHGLWRIPDGTCPETWDASADGYQEVAAPKADWWAEYKFEEPGTYWFACPVTGHCGAGMLIKYTVTYWREPQVYDLEWTFPSDMDPPMTEYPEQTVWVGDTANWTWTGTHGVWGQPTGDCPAAYDAAVDGYYEVKAATPDSWANWTFAEPGEYWFSCPVTGHCGAGMKVKYVVKDLADYMPTPCNYSEDAPKTYEIEWKDWEPYQGGYPEYEAKVGDSAHLYWAQGQSHNVYSYGGGDCPAVWDATTGCEMLAPESDGGSWNVTWDAPGTYWYASSAGTDCSEGKMKMKWTVA